MTSVSLLPRRGGRLGHAAQCRPPFAVDDTAPRTNVAVSRSGSESSSTRRMRAPRSLDVARVWCSSRSVHVLGSVCPACELPRRTRRRLGASPQLWRDDLGALRRGLGAARLAFVHVLVRRDRPSLQPRATASTTRTDHRIQGRDGRRARSTRRLLHRDRQVVVSAPRRHEVSIPTSSVRSDDEDGMLRFPRLKRISKSQNHAHAIRFASCTPLAVPPRPKSRQAHHARDSR